jgi:predicted HTH transcriptional regulator
LKGGTKGDTKQPRKGGTKQTEARGTKFSAKGGTRISLTERQRTLYDLLHDNNSLSIDEVARIFKVNASAVQKHFDALKEKGIIRRMGPTSGGFWEVLIIL